MTELPEMKKATRLLLAYGILGGLALLAMGAMILSAAFCPHDAYPVMGYGMSAMLLEWMAFEARDALLEDWRRR